MFGLFVALLVRRSSCHGPQAAAEGHCGDLVVPVRERNIEVFQAAEVLLADPQSLVVLGFAEKFLVPESTPKLLAFMLLA